MRIQKLMFVVLCSVALAGAHHQAKPKGSIEVQAPAQPAAFSADPFGPRESARPICPEGEKLHCTLGPPPVCSCV